jgi:PAS domain S-box-containing protein
VDANQLILADAFPAEVGKIYTDDPGDEIGATLKDRQVRTFVEVSKQFPKGIKQIVVPIQGASEQVIGAVVLEYTPLYDELMRLTRTTIRQVILAGCVGVLLTVLIAFYMGRSIARPLEQLEKVATGFASGRTDLPMPPSRKDEIGELATAFNHMVQERQRAEDELRRLHDGLEVRVMERTGELAKANAALQVENIERKQSEQALRDSEEKFRQLAENITDVFWMTSPDMQQTHYASPAYENIWGRSTAALYEHPQEWADAILPEDRERVFATFGRLAADEPHVSVEFRIARPNGEVRWILSRGFQVRDAAGKVIRITGVATDITERKAAEAETRELAERLIATFESLTDGFFTIDRNWRFTYVNHAAEKMLKLSRTELLGSNIWTKFPEARDTIFQKEYERALQDNVAVQFETFYPPFGVWFDARAFPSPQGLAVYFRDITGRKQAQADLEKAHKELVDASRQAGMAEVATGVLHNVGNVLNSVNIASSCVAESIRKSKASNLSKVVVLLREHETTLGAFLTDDPRGKLIPGFLAQLADRLSTEQAGMLKELAGLQTNIGHIKDIVTLQQGLAKVSGATETLSVTDLVEDALKMNSSALARHDITIAREFQPLPPITVEKQKVLQILVNLIRNAQQACDEANPPEKRLTFRVTERNARVCIAVADNGAGILPENIARIFAHGFTTKKTGHGFGLHSAALAAKEMGGSLAVHSDGPGQGATFTLELPAERKSSAGERRMKA